MTKEGGVLVIQLEVFAEPTDRKLISTSVETGFFFSASFLREVM